jgi:hypothetical protein
MRKVVRLFSVATAGLVMCLLFGSLALADDITCNCKKMSVSVIAHAVTTDPMSQYYAGPAVVTIGSSDEKKTYQANVVFIPQGPPIFAADGSIHSVFRNQISIPALASTFECWDRSVSYPVSGNPLLYTLNSEVTIFNGTGAFSDAYGKCIGSGELSIAEQSLSASGEGRVCDLGDIK